MRSPQRPSLAALSICLLLGCATSGAMLAEHPVAVMPSEPVWLDHELSLPEQRGPRFAPSRVQAEEGYQRGIAHVTEDVTMTFSTYGMTLSTYDLDWIKWSFNFGYLAGALDRLAMVKGPDGSATWPGPQFYKTENDLLGRLKNGNPPVITAVLMAFKQAYAECSYEIAVVKKAAIDMNDLTLSSGQ